MINYRSAVTGGSCCPYHTRYSHRHATHALVYITNIKQGGLPILVSFDMDATFDGDDVHRATSIHLQVDT